MRFRLLFLVFPFLISCSSDLDFNQIDDIEITQNFTASVLYFQVNQTKFLDNSGSAEVSDITDQSILDIFSPAYIKDNIVKAVFEFEIENTFDRDFDIEVTFLDANNQSIQTRALSSSQNSKNSTQISFENIDLEALKIANQIRLNIKLLPATTILDINKLMQLTLKSSVTLTLKVG